MLRYTHKHREDKAGKLRTAIAFAQLAVQEIERGSGTRAHLESIRGFLEEHPKNGFELLGMNQVRFEELAQFISAIPK